MLESTTYPGTTEDLFAKKLMNKFTIGKDIFLGYSPEREDPGNRIFSIENITKIVQNQILFMIFLIRFYLVVFLGKITLIV